MIRLRDLDKDIIVSVMSGLFYPNTTKDTYIYYNFLKTVLDTTEVVDEVYLIYAALDTLYDLYSVRRDVPIINKTVIMTIIEQNLYYEIKSVFDPGFTQYARHNVGIELNPLDDSSVLQVSSHVLGKCSSMIDNLILQNYTIEESRGHIPNLTQNYVMNINEELSQIMLHLNNGDSRVLNYQFLGWKKFLAKNKIYSNLDIPILLRIVASIVDSKVLTVQKSSEPITSLGKLLDLKAKFVNYSDPIAYWNMQILDQHLKIVPGTYTLLVGAEGTGKTTIGGWVTANLIVQGKKVLFYSPEIADHALLFSFVLPSYIYAKYGFPVTANQLVGAEPLYSHHDSLGEKERQDLVKAGELSFAQSGLFYHVTEPFHSNTVLDELRSKIIQYEPDVIIFDHTTELLGESDMNKVTRNVALAFEAIKREFFVHIIAFSHTGANFTIPTTEKPIVTSKICNWDKRLESVADNVNGLFRVGDKLNIFCKKSRWAPVYPMWISLTVDREHGWFTFDPKEQIGSQFSSDVIDKFLEESQIYTMESDEDEDDTFDPEYD